MCFPFILLSLLFIVTHAMPPPSSALYEGDECVLKDTGTSAICRPLQDCPSALQNLNRGLKPQRCGFWGNIEIVCCGKKTDIIKPTPTPNTPLNVTTSSRQRTSPSQIACSEYQNMIPLRINPFIYGGTVASEEEFPHMAALGFRSGSNGEITWGCGGSLISENFVLTAAHCTNTRIGDPVVVRLGQLDLTRSANEVAGDFSVSRVIRHPEYKRAHAYWDLALLELDQQVTFGRTIHPACLHTGNNPDLEQELIVCGWGAINRRNTEKSNILMKAFLRQVTLKECNKTYGEGVRLTANGVNSDMICAVDPTGNQDTCEGDSGGPLQITIDKDRDLYSIVGVTSMGPGLCGSKEPTIYTRVASFINWIESHVWPMTTRGPRNPTTTTNNNNNNNNNKSEDPRLFIDPIWPGESRLPVWMSSSRPSRRNQWKGGSRLPIWSVN